MNDDTIYYESGDEWSVWVYRLRASESWTWPPLRYDYRMDAHCGDTEYGMSVGVRVDPYQAEQFAAALTEAVRVLREAEANEATQQRHELTPKSSA